VRGSGRGGRTGDTEPVRAAAAIGPARYREADQRMNLPRHLSCARKRVEQESSAPRAVGSGELHRLYSGMPMPRIKERMESLFERHCG
jgi:hypothetical protein